MNPLGNLHNYDAIIIGAGHNGLVTATYLAKAGRRVLVCEKNDQVGGAAITQELFPGFKFSTVADGSGYLSQEVASDLKLEAHGLEILSSDSVVFSPQPDGSQLTIWRDTVRTCNEIAQFSAADAEAYPKFVELMSKIAGVVAGLCRVLPPDVPDFSWADLRSIPKLAGPIRRLGRKNINHLLRVLPMPITDLLNEWFESEPVKGAIAASAVRDISYGPYEAGTAYTFLYNWGLGDTGLFRSAGIIKGGMGKLTETMADAARSFGAEIRTSTAVESVILEEDRFSGVKLAGGEVVNAKILVSNAAPRTTFVDLVDPGVLKANFVRHLRNIKYRGSGARIHLALRDLPEFTALGSGDAAAVLRGPIQIAPTMKYLQQAYNCVKYGQFSPRPYLDITIPSLLDPSLAPEGQHVMSITAKYAPNDLRVGQWDASREPFTEAVLDTLAEYAPNIRDLILHKRTLVPPDLEAEFGLPEGNPNHGEMTLDQFFHMRPIPGYARYRTPVEGMYLCGAGAHPGGGVTGIPGQNAAREILRGASFRPHSQSTGPE